VLLVWAGLQLCLVIRLSLLADAPPAVAYWSHLAGFMFGALAFVVMNRVAPALPRRAPLAQPAANGD
jgi:membrane associated rhomboid family serine protease